MKQRQTDKDGFPLYTLEELRRVAILVSDRAFSDDLLKNIDKEIKALDAPL